MFVAPSWQIDRHSSCPQELLTAARLEKKKKRKIQTWWWREESEMQGFRKLLVQIFSAPSWDALYLPSELRVSLGKRYRFIWLLEEASSCEVCKRAVNRVWSLDWDTLRPCGCLLWCVNGPQDRARTGSIGDFPFPKPAYWCFLLLSTSCTWGLLQPGDLLRGEAWFPSTCQGKPTHPASSTSQALFLT